MPSIENIRKQAKPILRWHRGGYHPVATRIRSHFPDYRSLADRQVLAATLRLSKVQDLVARRSGFADWRTLTKGVDAMATSTPASDETITILAAEPQIVVADMQRSLAFRIGPLVTGPVFDGAFRARNADALSATLTPIDVKPLCPELQRAGVAFHQSLRSEPWRAPTFTVADPGGNLIGFAGDA